MLAISVFNAKISQAWNIDSLHKVRMCRKKYVIGGNNPSPYDNNSFPASDNQIFVCFQLKSPWDLG